MNRVGSDKKPVIAIDGPAAAGKSTVAAKVAEILGATYINTGNMYRAITLAAATRGTPLENPSEKDVEDLLRNTSLEYTSSGGSDKILLNGEDVTRKIRAPELAASVSRIAAIPSVRKWLVDRQREIASKAKLAVMEGRDIGTVVFPDAKWKFFLTASPEVRARRRLEQSGETIEGSTVASVAREIAERDKMDMSRKVSPLTRAADAILVDSSEMTIDQVLDRIVDTVKGDMGLGDIWEK
jgi:cytidylate kinase